MKKKLALAGIAAGLVVTLLTGCGDDMTVSRANVKVEPQGNNLTYIRYRNGYRFGGVEIVENEDNTYTVIITALPPDAFYTS